MGDLEAISTLIPKVKEIAIKEAVKVQGGHSIQTNKTLKKCTKCGDYIEFIKPAFYINGQLAVAEKIMPRECYCQLEAQKRKEDEEKRAREKAKLMEKYKAADIPPRFLGWSFETVAESENKKFCQQYVDCFDINLTAGTGIFMIGDKGRGKTTLSICILKELVKQGYSAITIPFGQMLDMIMATNSANSFKTKEQILNDFLKFDFIIFDDFGRETYTEKQISKAFWIIDELNKKQKCICLTANPEMIAKLKDKEKFKYAEEFEAILDRLQEMCPRTLIFEGKSFRGVKNG